jgi:hypothetical protein
MEEDGESETPNTYEVDEKHNIGLKIGRNRRFCFLQVDGRIILKLILKLEYEAGGRSGLSQDDVEYFILVDTVLNLRVP